jgi:hypothetical protein
MAKTLWELFPGVDRIIDRIQVEPRAARFPAAAAAGAFTWDLSVPIMKLDQSETGIIAGVSFAANVSDTIFSNAIDPAFNDGYFTLDLIRDGNQTPVNLAPFKFATAGQAQEFSCMARPTGTENFTESFSLKLRGRLLQTPEILALGKGSLSLTCVFNLYRAKDELKR